MASHERVSSQVAGWIGAAHPTYVPELAGVVEIGWTLRRPFWGLGLASEGAAAAVKTAFAHLVLDEVVSLINPANARSISVAETTGHEHRQRCAAPGHLRGAADLPTGR